MTSQPEDSTNREASVVTDALARLALRFDRKSLQFSDEELHTLAERAREFSRASGAQKEELASYKTHLATLHGANGVGRVWMALEQIYNDIDGEEK